MLQPELIRLLTESDYLDKACIGGMPTLGSLTSEFRQSGDNINSPFSFTPQRIHIDKDHEFFEDGDIHRHMYLQDLFATEADEDKPKISVSEFGCHISGCMEVFSSVEQYELHYNSLHRHVCCSCRRSLPSARLLDIHLQEWHDSLFTVLSQRQDMYQCLVEGCGQKFRTSLQRKDHLIRIHKYPSDFRFDKAKKGKNNRTRDIRSDQQRGVDPELMEDGGVSEGAAVALEVPEDGEAMEIHLPQEPGTVEEAAASAAPPAVYSHLSTHSPTQQDSTAPAHPTVHSPTQQDSTAPAHPTVHSPTQQPKPRYSYRVPATVCFGQGSIRGFRGVRRGGRTK